MSSFNLNTILNNKFFTMKWFDPNFWFNLGSIFFHSSLAFLFTGESLNIFNLILSLFSLFFCIMIAYCFVRMFEIRAKEREYLKHEIAEYAHHQAEKETELAAGEEISKNERWLAVLRHLVEPNQSDWKLAIVEADSMLEGLMDQLGFKGENLGDKLKTVDRDKFHNLTSAWEVHTIRNRIAHEGLNFEISQHEAKRVIALYEQIFREFGYI